MKYTSVIMREGPARPREMLADLEGKFPHRDSDGFAGTIADVRLHGAIGDRYLVATIEAAMAPPPPPTPYLSIDVDNALIGRGFDPVKAVEDWCKTMRNVCDRPDPIKRKVTDAMAEWKAREVQ